MIINVNCRPTYKNCSHETSIKTKYSRYHGGHMIENTIQIGSTWQMTVITDIFVVRFFLSY